LCHNAEVFRLEDGLDKVFQRVGEITGVRYSKNPGIRKQSVTHPLSIWKTDRHLISKIYADDFRRFGYEMKPSVAS